MTKIIAMTYGRKIALTNLFNLHFQIADHLFLITHYKDNTAYSHWEHELVTWAGKLRRLNKAPRPRKTNYSKAILLENLWTMPFGTQEDRKEVGLQIAREKNLPIVEPNEKELKKAVADYIESILK